MSAAATTGPVTTGTETQIDDTSNTIAYAGTWIEGSTTDQFDGTYKQTKTGGSFADISFTGTNITVTADTWYDHGRYYCALDQTPPYFWGNSSIGSPTTTVQFNLTLCSLTGFSDGAHVLRVGLEGAATWYLDVSQRGGGQRALLINDPGAQIDSYILNSATPAGNQLVWKSDFPSIAPPSQDANTTVIPTLSSSASKTPASSGTSVTSSSTSSSSAAVATGHHSSSNGAAVGGGVGAGIGVALISLGLGWYLYTRRNRKRAESILAEKGETLQRPPTAQMYAASSPERSQYNYSGIDRSDSTPDYGFAGHPEPSSYDNLTGGNATVANSTNYDLEDPASFTPYRSMPAH